MDKLRQYFPDFDPATLPPIPEGWTDISWTNDAMPGFEVGVFQVYIDYLAPEMRETPEGPRFIVMSIDHGDPLLETDDWAEVLAFVQGARDMQYKTPKVEPAWAEVREAHPAIAMAIHAIASAKRSPEAIWQAPTEAEDDHVAMALEQYLRAGLFDLEPEHRYAWGDGGISIYPDW